MDKSTPTDKKRTTQEKLEAIRSAKEKLDLKARRLRAFDNGQERKADTHIKAAIGGAVMSMFDTMPRSNVVMILKNADAGIQKQGVGREKFEFLKATYFESLDGTKQS